MGRLTMAAVLTLILPAAASAAPCLPATLTAYIGLGGTGCSIGSATANDFSLDVFDPLATALSPDDIFVTPTALPHGPRLDFGVTQGAGPGEFFDAVIGYSLTAPGIRSARLFMEGATATTDGVVTAVEDICVGDTFFSDPTTCFLGTPLPPLIVFQDGLGGDLDVQMGFAPASFFDVFTELAIDGGVAGTAGLNGFVRNEFSTRGVPEPATILLFGSALVALARRRRTSNRD
jgi:hypothetical protein